MSLMTISKAELLEVLDSIDSDEVVLFPSSVFYGSSDPEAKMVGRNYGLHQQGVFIKAV